MKKTQIESDLVALWRMCQELDSRCYALLGSYKSFLFDVATLPDQWEDDEAHLVGMAPHPRTACGDQLREVLSRHAAEADE